MWKGDVNRCNSFQQYRREKKSFSRQLGNQSVISPPWRLKLWLCATFKNFPNAVSNKIRNASPFDEFALFKLTHELAKTHFWLFNKLPLKSIAHELVLKEGMAGIFEIFFSEGNKD